MASSPAKPKPSLDSFLSFLHQQPVAGGQGSSAGGGADLDPEAIADLIWLTVHQPAMDWSSSRTNPSLNQPRPTRKPEPAPVNTPQGEDTSSSNPQGSTATSTMGSTLQEPEQAPSHLEAQLLPEASVPGSERLPVWVNDPLELLDPQQLYEAVLPLMQPVAGDQPAGLDEAGTLDHYLQWRQLIPVWQPDQHYRFSLTLILDQGFSMIVWQPLLEHLRDRLRGFHGFRDIQVLLWDNNTELPASSPAAAGGDHLTVVISDCAGSKWWNTNGPGPGAAFATLQRLGAEQPLVIRQVLPSWMWSRTALGQGEAIALRRSDAGARWPFQIARRPAGLSSGAAAAERPLPVFELTPEGVRSWGALMGGNPFLIRSGILLPAEPRSALQEAEEATAGGVAEASEREAPTGHPSSEEARRRDELEEQDPLMPLRRFQHLASQDSRRLMALFAAAPVLTLPVMRLIQAALLEGTGTAALAEVVLSGLLRPLDRNPNADSKSDLEAVQFSFAAPIREALLRQQSPTSTLQVIEEVTDFIAAHWSRKGWGSFRAFLLDPSIAAPAGQERSQHFANLAADIIAALGGSYASFAERLRQAQRRDPWPRNLFRFEPLETEAAQLLRIPTPEPVAFTSAMEHPVEPWRFSFSWVAADGEPRTGNGRGYREVLRDAAPYASGPQSLASTHTTGTLLPMLHIPAGRFLMGSPAQEEGRYANEGPQHEVELREFFLSQTPITQAQWRAVAEWTRHEHEDTDLWPEELEPDPVARLEEAERFAGEKRPVVAVSWHEAMAFCQRLRLRTGKNYTLPSEAQWEYACRAGTATPFHFGETISAELANYYASEVYADGKEGEYRLQTTEVAIFPANAWGLQDMHGNVWEWCLDHWHESYEGAPEHGRAWLDEDVKENQQQKNRLLRGGSWSNHPGGCRSAYRGTDLPGYPGSFIGFRVCCLPQDLILYP